MSQPLRILFLLTFGNLGLLAYFTIFGALFPNRIARTKALADTMPGRSFLIGLVNFGFFGGLALGFIALSEFVGSEFLALPAIILLGLIGAGASFGLAAVSQLLSERIWPEMPFELFTIIVLSALVVMSHNQVNRPTS